MRHRSRHRLQLCRLHLHRVRMMTGGLSLIAERRDSLRVIASVTTAPPPAPVIYLLVPPTICLQVPPAIYLPVLRTLCILIPLAARTRPLSTPRLIPRIPTHRTPTLRHTATATIICHRVEWHTDRTHRGLRPADLCSRHLVKQTHPSTIKTTIMLLSVQPILPYSAADPPRRARGSRCRTLHRPTQRRSPTTRTA